MKTIKIEFQSNGKTITKTAILNDSLTDVSKSKNNQASYIDDYDEYNEEGFWSVIFQERETLLYEVEFEYDIKKQQKTLKPIKALTWEDEDCSTLTDVQKVKVIYQR